MAAAGSAIGLGNIWRYPYVAYENGGGAFLVPYFIALATAGIPLLILEYGVGHRARRGGPGAFRWISKKLEPIGWWQVTLAFFIVCFYAVIIAWALAYAVFSVTTAWGSSDDAEDFFFGDFLGMGESFWQIGGLNLKVLIPVVIVWLVIFVIMRRGVSKGIELTSKILMPILVVAMLIIVVRGLTLEGAGAGLAQLFQPDFAALADPGVWIAAYGQVFFSLSVGFATMLTYASYLKRKTDLPNTAIVVGLANAGFEFLAAIGVFSVIGFFAVQQGVEVQDAVASGPGLAFVTIPAIISEMPAGASLIGVLFFVSLMFAGLTSAVSLLEPPVAAIQEKFRISRAFAVNLLCGAAFLIGLIYVTDAGLYFLDTADNFLNNYGLVIGAFAMLIAFWFTKQWTPLQNHLNEYAYLRAGAWWKITISVVSPILIGVMAVLNLATLFREGYEGYPTSGLLGIGGGVLALSLLIALVMPFVRRELDEVTPGAAASGGGKSGGDKA